MGRGLPPYRTELLGSARHPQSRYSRCLRPLSRRRFGGRTDGIDLRIRRLGVRVPPSALTFSQLNVLIIFVLLIPSASRSSSCRILAASGHPGRLVEPVGVAVRLPWVQVPLDVQRRGDAGMAHDLRDLPEQADTLSFQFRSRGSSFRISAYGPPDSRSRSRRTARSRLGSPARLQATGGWT